MIYFTNFLLQYLSTVGLTLAFGLAIWALKKVFYRLSGAHARKVCIATGFLGTPVHELGHAFFCVVFGHKITEIKLFQPNNTDGVLGYVNHSFRKKNIYHQIGNFFIGFGPILFGSGVLALLMFLLVPDLFFGLGEIGQTIEGLRFDFSAADFHAVFGALWSMVCEFFSLANLTNVLWWIFMIPSCSIALHMSLSAADVKGSKIGFAVVTAVWLIIDVILYFVGNTMFAFTAVCLRVGGFLCSFYMIAILLSLLLIGIGLIFKGLSKLRKR